MQETIPDERSRLPSTRLYPGVTSADVVRRVLYHMKEAPTQGGFQANASSQASMAQLKEAQRTRAHTPRQRTPTNPRHTDTWD